MYTRDQLEWLYRKLTRAVSESADPHLEIYGRLSGALQTSKLEYIFITDLYTSIAIHHKLHEDDDCSQIIDLLIDELMQ